MPVGRRSPGAHLCAKARKGGGALLVVASNRLPVSVKRRGAGFDLVPTPGGLAVGLESLRLEGKLRWVGWPGNVAPAIRGAVSARLKEALGCDPVFLPQRLVRLYYNGFCNRTLWPLFHGLPSIARFNEAEWRAYAEANALFAEHLNHVAGPDDSFWIQDFQLLLVPKLLRELRPEAKIGFFLHIPFPAYETLRVLPWHKELLEGLSGADLVGFHTYDFAQAYLSCLRRLLGVDNNLGEVVLPGRSFQVDVFPMGIDFARFAAATQKADVQREVAKLRAGAPGKRITMSLSRLDYTKGIPQLLDALELFLTDHPEWRGRFHHLLVTVPSRENVGEYRQLKREIDERVGRLNGRYGTVGWTPVRYIFRYLPFEQLVSLYACADVALIVPRRDGMNLIAKEYLATRADGQGVLILSELAGAARELTQALIVNPNSREEIARALHTALEMPAAEKAKRAMPMREQLSAHDVASWAGRFLVRLDKAAGRSRRLAARRLTAAASRDLVGAFGAARESLLLLDYDGTLVPFAPDPAAPAPDGPLLELLASLASRPGARVVILSGRDRTTLSRWFGELPVTLVAEHGVWVREAHTRAWERVVRSDTAWKGPLNEVLSLFVDRIPGSFVEEKECSLVWHWRGADPHIGADAARELIEALTSLTANTEVVVLPGNKVVEVKTAAAGKGTFFLERFGEREWPFLLAIGDDLTDETLFRALPPTAHSLRVGHAASAARYNIEDTSAVRELLGRMAAVATQSPEVSAPPA